VEQIKRKVMDTSDQIDEQAKEMSFRPKPLKSPSNQVFSLNDEDILLCLDFMK